jgi:hypothetical protein
MLTFLVTVPPFVTKYPKKGSMATLAGLREEHEGGCTQGEGNTRFG